MGFEHGGDHFHPSHISPSSLPSPSCGLQWDNLVVSHVGVFLVLEAKGRDGLSEPDLVANGVLYLSVQDVPAIDVNS